MPKEGDADFVCAMEDVLEVYKRPYDSARPLVCLDEASKQLVADITPPQPPQPGRPARQDYEQERFEVHHTPKHASWLNIAECELSVLGRQCLSRRLDAQVLLEREVAAWEDKRNGQEVRVDWQFTTSAARIKLKRLYPVLAPTKSTKPDH